jgi:hypothetical protein
MKELANVLKGRLIGLPFLDVVAGIVQPVIDTKFKMVDNTAISRKLPVSYDVTGKGTQLGLERQLVPDQSKKSILYFEDFGSTTDTAAKVGTRAFISNIRLVFWMNKINCGFEKYDEVSLICIDDILDKLISTSGINGNGISRLFVSNPRILIQDANVFSRYNYDEAVTQYLRPPFEFFGIDLTCKYSVSRVVCGGHKYEPKDLVPVKWPILIQEGADVTNKANRQLLDNGWWVPLAYPPGTTLTVPQLVGFPILAPFIINKNVMDEIKNPVPFDSETATWDVGAHEIAYFNPGDEIFINASLPEKAK